MCKKEDDMFNKKKRFSLFFILFIFSFSIFSFIEVYPFGSYNLILGNNNNKKEVYLVIKNRNKEENRNKNKDNRTELNQASDIIPRAFQQKCSQFHRQPYEITGGIRHQWVF